MGTQIYMSVRISIGRTGFIERWAGAVYGSPPLSLRRTSQFSMGLDFSDINRDGHLDFLTVDMLSRSHKRRKTRWE